MLPHTLSLNQAIGSVFLQIPLSHRGGENFANSQAQVGLLNAKLPRSKVRGTQKWTGQPKWAWAEHLQ